MARQSRSGYRIAIASNQSGVSRGLFALSELHAMHQRLREILAEAGGRIEMIAFCPHGPDAGCVCRKPGPGLLEEIADRLDCNLAGVPFIGDSISDVRAARRGGAEPWLVRTGKGERTLARLRRSDPGTTSELDGVPVFLDLAEACERLIQSSRYI